MRDDAVGLECFVEADLVGGHGLDLDDFFSVVLLDQVDDDAVGLVGIGGPVHVASCGGAGGFELQEIFIEMRERVLLDGAGGGAQLLPVLLFLHDDGALAGDDVGGVADILARAACRRAAVKAAFWKVGASAASPTRMFIGWPRLQLTRGSLRGARF